VGEVEGEEEGNWNCWGMGEQGGRGVGTSVLLSTLGETSSLWRKWGKVVFLVNNVPVDQWGAYSFYTIKKQDHPNAW